MYIIDYAAGLTGNKGLILFLILLIVILISVISVMFYSIIKEEKDKKEKNEDIIKVNSEEEKFNIEEVKKNLEDNMGSEDRYIKINEYEVDQEKKAIISYDELLKNASSLTINYEDENSEGGIKVKKVEIEKKKDSDGIQINTSHNTSFYNYEREEEFLNALKQFRANL